MGIDYNMRDWTSKNDNPRMCEHPEVMRPKATQATRGLEYISLLVKNEPKIGLDNGRAGAGPGSDQTHFLASAGASEK